MRPGTILVVEDDALLRMDTMAAFADAGYDVIERQNADDALGYLLEKADGVAVVFTDVCMPGHSDGIHLAEVIARHWPQIHVVVTSGCPEPLRELPKQVRFLQKPWAPGHLLDLMNRALEAA